MSGQMLRPDLRGRGRLLDGIEAIMDVSHCDRCGEMFVLEDFMAEVQGNPALMEVPSATYIVHAEKCLLESDKQGDSR